MVDEVRPAGPSVRLGAGQFRAAFQSLHYRSYRYLWFGQVGHAASLWMEQVVRPLLMLYLTGSAYQVGGIVAARMVPQLVLGLVAGAVADRYNKKLVLMSSSVVTLVMQVALGLLIITGAVEIWHIYVTAVISGTSNAFRQPARQSMVPRVVPREALLNALALNTAAMNTMRIAGAGLAGALLIPFDFGEVYLITGALEAFVLLMTMRVVLPPEPPRQAAATGGLGAAADRPGRRSRQRSRSLLTDLLEGFRYMRSNPVALHLIAAALILFITVQPYQQVFIPLITTDVLQADRSMVGLLFSVTGMGALTGAMVVAVRGHVPHRGIVMLGALVLTGTSLILFAQSHWLWLSFVALYFAGVGPTLYISLNNSLLIEQTPPEYHGRVLSLMSLDRGLVSVGALIGAVLAGAFGPAIGLTAMAVATITLALLTYLLVAPIRRLD